MRTISRFRFDAGTSTAFLCAFDPLISVVPVAAGDQSLLDLLTDDRADATTDRQRTLSGVGIGSTADEVRTTYGDRVTEEVAGDGVRLTFEPNESIVPDTAALHWAFVQRATWIL